MATRSGFALGVAAGAVLGAVLAHAPFSSAAPAAPATPSVPAAANAAVAGTTAATPNVREFKILGTDYRGTKRWEPGTLICYVGETVRITLINKIPAEPPTHGFTIAAFNV